MSLSGPGVRYRSIAVAALLVAAGACERNAPLPPPSPPPATKLASPPARADSAAVADSWSPRLAPGADDRDAANAPAVLPRSHDIAGWVKHEPVRVVAPDDLDSLVSDGTLRAAMQSYRLKSVAQCVYRYSASETAPPLLLDVLWIEAAESDDAFGLFSVLAPPPRGLSADGGQIAERRDMDGALRLLGWQGRNCVRMVVADDDERGTKSAAARLLRAKLLFSVPRADPPALLRLMPHEHHLPEHEWLVRSAAALRLPGAGELPAVDLEALDGVLGLDGRVLLAIAAYEVSPGESPNYVWVAQYPEPEAAAEAVERYRSRLEQSQDEFDRNTMISEPQGRLVAGTWTADQESIQHLLPRLLASVAPALGD